MPEEDVLQPPTVLEHLQMLVDQAKQGDPDAMRHLQLFLDEYPEVWQYFGDLAGRAERGWIGLLAGESPHVKESLLRQVAVMRAEIAGPQPSPLESLLVDRVVASWLQVRYFEIATVAHNTGQTPTSREAQSLSRQVDAAQRRHLAAVRGLMDARRLLGRVSNKKAPATKPPASNEKTMEEEPVPDAAADIRFDDVVPFVAVI
jgi:hypothetical protein